MLESFVRSGRHLVSRNENGRLHAESNVVVGGLDLSGLAYVMADTLVGSRRLWEAHDSIAAGVLWGCVTKKPDRRCTSVVGRQ